MSSLAASASDDASSDQNIKCCAPSVHSAEQCCAPSVNSAEPCVQNGSGTVLQTARVFVKGSTGTVRATLLFDSGSDRSSVSSSLIEKLKLKKVSVQPVSCATFGSGKVKGSLRNVFDLHLESLLGDVRTLRASEEPVICAPLKRKGVPRDLVKAFGPLRFADSYVENRDVEIDILVGQDFYWKFMKVGVVRAGDLVAQETVFGWVVSGCWTVRAAEPDFQPSVSLCCLSDIPEERLNRFWDLDSVGFSDKGSEVNKRPSDDTVFQKFCDTVSRVKIRKKRPNREEIATSCFFAFSGNIDSGD